MIDKKNLKFIKIGIFTSSRSEISYLTPLIKFMQKQKGISPMLFVGGTHLSRKYGNTIEEIKKNKLKITDFYKTKIMQSTKENIIFSLAESHRKIAKIFLKHNFDVLCVMGDRFEKMAEVNNAILFNKPIIHLHGGEKTKGVIDDQIRNMITKSSHLHFVTCKAYKKNLIRMGEKKSTIYISGSLTIDNIKNTKKIDKKKLFKKLNLNVNKPVSLLSYHPNTLKDKSYDLFQLHNIIKALKRFNLQVVMTSPGFDFGQFYIDSYLKKISSKNKNFFYFKSLGHENLFNLIPYSKFMIGNSSSGVVEVPFFKIPTINVGSRQEGRIFHLSVINCGNKTNDIYSSINKSLQYKFRNKLKRMKYIFGNGKTAKKILKVLKNTNFDKKILIK